MNSERFEFELGLITDKECRSEIAKILDAIPEGILDKPVGLYKGFAYRKWLDYSEIATLEESAKASVRLANLLYQHSYISGRESLVSIYIHDVVIGAVLLKDLGKYMSEEETQPRWTHPLDISNFIIDLYGGLDKSPQYVVDVVTHIVTSSGEWNTKKGSDVILPTPTVDSQKLVHFIDWILSKPLIGVNTTDRGEKYCKNYE